MESGRLDSQSRASPGKAGQIRASPGAPVDRYFLVVNSRVKVAPKIATYIIVSCFLCRLFFPIIVRGKVIKIIILGSGILRGSGGRIWEGLGRLSRAVRPSERQSDQKQHFSDYRYHCQRCMIIAIIVSVPKNTADNDDDNIIAIIVSVPKIIILDSGKLWDTVG